MIRVAVNVPEEMHTHMDYSNMLWYLSIWLLGALANSAQLTTPSKKEGFLSNAKVPLVLQASVVALYRLVPPGEREREGHSCAPGPRAAQTAPSGPVGYS